MSEESNYTIKEAFPDADPGIKPFGSRILLQIRNPKQKTQSGIILSSDTIETEQDNTQVAKVIDMGSLSFRNRNTMEPWPEGAWCQPGDFVRVPKYGGDRWKINMGEDISVTFAIYNDLDIIGQVTTDPCKIKAFI